MESIHVEIPDSLRDYLNGQVTKGGFDDAGDYLIRLLEVDQEIRESVEPYTRGERLEQLLLEGIDSGDAGPMTDEDWEELKRPYRNS